MSDGMRCPDCEREHMDWKDDGSHHVNDGHHRGVIERWECAHCGYVLEEGRP